ncbi:hypothetical protein HDU98_002478, partial [Podochytrium sp. JEL0797]
VNKHVLGSGFPFASTLTALHQLFCFVFTKILIWWGVIPKIPAPPPGQLFSRVGVAVLYSSGLVLMNQSLASNSVSFYQILKISCIPAIAFLQYILYGTRLSTSTIVSLVFILLGVFIIGTTTDTPNLASPSPSNNTNASQTYTLIISLLAVFSTALSQITLHASPDMKRLTSLQSLSALSFTSFLVCGTAAVAIDVGIYPGEWARLVLSLSGVSRVLYTLVPSEFEWLLFSGEDLDLVKRVALDAGGDRDYREFLGGVTSRAYLTEHMMGKFVSFLNKVGGGGGSGGVQQQQIVLGWVFVSCMLSVLTNLFGFAVIKETSAMTYQVVGHFKTVATLTLGAVLFGMDGLKGLKGAGLALAFVGMVLYSKKKDADSDTDAEAALALPSLPSLPPLPPHKSSFAANVVVVRRRYAATANDELSLKRVGDEIYILERFEDGWAFGVDRSRGTRGVFPLACTASISDASLPRPPPATPTHSGNSRTTDLEYTTPTNPAAFRRRESSKNYASGSGGPTGVALGSRSTANTVVSDDGSRVSEDIPYVHPAGGFYGGKRVSSVDCGVFGSSPGDMDGVVAYYGGAGEGVVMRVVHAYVAQAADELTLVVGHDIIMLAEFEDGWGLGMLPLSAQKGAFPMPCVIRFEDAGSEASSGFDDW